MASIFERKRLDGSSVWRVNLYKKNCPKLSVTFYDYEEAVDWVLKNEKDYYLNPEKYRQWKEDMYIKNMKNRYSHEKKTLSIRKRY